MPNYTPLELVYAGSLQSFTLTPETNISGNNTLYMVANDDKTVRVTSANQVVTSVTGVPQWNLFLNLKSLTYKINTVKKRSGITYAVDINFSIPRVNQDVTQLLSNLLNNRVTVIIGDHNGHFLLFGLHEPMEAVTLDIINADANQYDVKLTTVQKRIPQEVAAACVAGLPLTPTIDTIATLSVVLVDGGVVPGGVIVSPKSFPYTLPFTL